MKVLVALSLFVTLIALSEGLFGGRSSRGRSLGGSSRNRFALLLRNRKTSLFGNRLRGSDSIFGSLASKIKKPTCHFDTKGVPQYSWPTKDKLCFDETFVYPTDQVFNALEQDLDAIEYLTLVQNAYVNEAVNRTGFLDRIRYKDLCDEHGPLLERIWWTNTKNGNREVCYVIMPEAQGVYVPLGGGNCVMDKTDVKHHYCVPDGFVDRDIYVFCPGEYKQCRRTRVSVPTGCSCKKYECLKYEVI